MWKQQWYFFLGNSAYWIFNLDIFPSLIVELFFTIGKFLLINEFALTWIGISHSCNIWSYFNVTISL